MVDNVTPVLLSALGCWMPYDQGTPSAVHSAICAGHTWLHTMKQLLDQI